MEPEQMVLAGVFAVVVIVPTVAISARLAIRPIVDAIVRLRESAGSAESARSDARFARLESQMTELASHMERLAAAESFHTQLRAGTHVPPSPPSLPPSPPASPADV